MASELNVNEDLQQELKIMKICRFCLSRDKLTGIFLRTPNQPINLAPLTVQVMACASIEVFSNDGMPSFICWECRLLFEHSYRFKQMCKRADTLLRQYTLTGSMPAPLQKPKIPALLLENAANANSNNKKPTILQQIVKPPPSAPSGGVKKLLNAAPAPKTESLKPMRFTFKSEPTQDEIRLLNKFDNGEEVLMEDVQKIIANAGDDDFIYASSNSSPPKLLNKTTKRMTTIDLDKEAEFSKPKMQVNLKGQMELVTAIVQPSKQDTTAKELAADPVETDNFPCPFCERSFPLVQLRDIHLTRHNRERNFQCPNCEKSFFSKYDLQKHEVRHTGEKPFKCTICEKSFTRMTLLRRHERIHTDVPKFLCMYCEQPFISKDELEVHIARHEKNRPFKCEQCGKSFAFKQGLERHEVVHSAVLPYPCQYCDQSFSTPSKLSRHLNAHAGDRPFPCKYCNKSYLLSHHLTRHLRSHKQEKSNENHCIECKKVFHNREALIYHTAVHSTATLICSLCRMKFDSENEVPAHIKLHIEGESFACEFCDLLFLTTEDLTKHYDETHSAEVDQFKYNANVVDASPTKSKRQGRQPPLTVLELDSKHVTADTVEEYIVQELEQDDDEANFLTVINEDVVSENFPQYETNVNNDNNTGVLTNQLDSPEKPKILNQIVFQTSNIGSVDKIDGPSSAKIRKVVARDGKLQVVEPAEVKAPRRKVAENAVKIKVEKPDPVVEQRAKVPSLPKGVTVRKTSTAANSKQTSVASTAEPKAIKKLTLAEAQAVVTQKRTKEAEKTSEKTATRVKTRRSGGSDTSTNAKESKEVSPSTSKSAEKATKVKQVRMTKAMADELAKQGRIKFKDGQMILTKPSK